MQGSGALNIVFAGTVQENFARFCLTRFLEPVTANLDLPVLVGSGMQSWLLLAALTAPGSSRHDDGFTQVQKLFGHWSSGSLLAPWVVLTHCTICGCLAHCTLHKLFLAYSHVCDSLCEATGIKWLLLGSTYSQRSLLRSHWHLEVAVWVHR